MEKVILDTEKEKLYKTDFIHCIICRCLNSRPYNYWRSPDLPLSLVDNSYPCICTGIDYTGAVYCKSIMSILNAILSFIHVPLLDE